MSEFSSLADAAERIERREITPLELVERCLTRIARHEPDVKAWVAIDDRGRREASRLGELLGRGEYLGPLHGIPMGIKDIFDVAGFATRAGSTLRSTDPVEHDALLVARLRAAGAVILGKTVTTQYAFVDPPPTRNPWNLERTPGGSSSGSAAAIAARMCLAAVGSQTGGSTIRPAAYCGVAGFKPSYGLLPLEGVVPLSQSLDHVGLFAPRGSDLRLVFSAIAGESAAARRGGREMEFPRLAWIENFPLSEADETVQRGIEAAAAKLASAGCEIKSLRLPKCFDEARQLHRRLMAIEAGQYHRAQFAASRSAYGPKLAELIDEGLSFTADDYAAVRQHQKQLKAEFDAAFEVDRLTEVDALIMPAAPTTAPARDSVGEPTFNSVWSYAGLPAATIPCGLANDGLPIGLQLIGRRHGDLGLLAVTAICEKMLDFRDVPPMRAGGASD